MSADLSWEGRQVNKLYGRLKGNRNHGFETYFDSLGIDSKKWVTIFKERLGIVNKNGIENLRPDHYEKVQEFVI